MPGPSPRPRPPPHRRPPPRPSHPPRSWRTSSSDPGRWGTNPETAKTPVRVRWSTTTPLPMDARFEFEGRVDDGPFEPLALESARADLFDGSLILNRTHRFRVRSVADDQGPSAWRYGSPLRVVQLQESSSRVTYTGDWFDELCERCSGQSRRETIQGGASASLSFSGRDVAVIASHRSRGWTNAGVDRRSARADHRSLLAQVAT